MLNRRQFVKAAGVAALVPSACVSTRSAGEDARAPISRPTLVNDIHSQLNPTTVADIRQPSGVEELLKIVRASNSPLCMAGGRHAMGGQQFAEGATLIDMTSMNHVLDFDSARGIVDVEAGIQWPELVAYLVDAQRGANSRTWGIRQKQTGADRLTIGGALAANAHGRGLKMKPFVGDVESFTLVSPSGERLECSRSANSDLFALAIGGYGLFGVIASVRLRLAPRKKLERVVEVRQIEDIAAAFDQRVRSGFLYGDFQFSINERSDNFLRRGVFSCYRPVADDTPMPPTRELQVDDWRKLLLLAHADKERAYDEYVGYYLSTSGQLYWSDEHQLSVYIDDYHQQLDPVLRASGRATEIITEVYVPRERLADFMVEAGEDFRRNSVNVIYGTVRMIERDDETFLPWAKQNYACVIFNLHTEHTPAGQQHSADAFRRLIDMAIARGGSYFLTYHRYARRDQVEACYPQMAGFLRKKREYDPGDRLQSEWYRHYKTMFSA